MMRLAAAWLLLLAAPALADTLDMPGVVERDAPIAITYRLDQPATGTGALTLDWTDSTGRVVEHRSFPVVLTGSPTIALSIDPRRAVSMRNALHAALTLNGDATGDASASFIARPPAAWDDWQIFHWSGADAARTAGLHAIGVTAGKILGIRDTIDPAEFQRRTEILLQDNQRWFVENIATDFYAAYHMWTPGHPNEVNWRFNALQKRALTDPSDPTLLVRRPSLIDPAWRERIRARLAATVADQAPYRPFFYNLADESGIADLTAAWDFDFSPLSLGKFRDWLRARYPTIQALDSEWGASFADWAEVTPPTTLQAMQRADQNYAGWSDMKAFMDASFADALAAGVQAVHQADPTARAAIEGGQVPGWGGYDYARLATRLDVMEMYDGDNNVEIARALNPALTVISTSFESGPREQHRIWHSLLLGERGLVIWDDADNFVTADGAPGPRPIEDGPTYDELRGGIAAQFMAAVPVHDQVAILYSPPSFRMRWMLDHRADGPAWMQRGSERETDDNSLRVDTRMAAASFIHAGLQPRWLTPAAIAAGALRQDIKVLALPETLAVSPGEAAEIAAFRARGGLVFASGSTGIFDGHGRKLDHPAIDPDLLAPLATLTAGTAQAGIGSGFTLAKPDGTAVADVDIRSFRSGGVTLLGLQRDRDRAGTPSPPMDVVLTWPKAAYIRDLRGGEDWQKVDHMPIHLDSVIPTLLAIAPSRPPGLQLVGPPDLHVGQTAHLHLTRVGPDPTAIRVVHIDVLNPEGHVVPDYSGNLILRSTEADWSVPFATNDPTGTWTFHIHDIIGGPTASVTAELD